MYEIDVKTRKILCLNGSFHVNSDVDRLHSHRNSGGRGLNSINDLYISRIISISRHLKEQANQTRLFQSFIKRRFSFTTFCACANFVNIDVSANALWQSPLNSYDFN